MKFVYSTFNKVRRILGSLSCLQRKIPYLLGHHGESGSAVTGFGSFYGSVKRQKIGPKGNFINCFDDFKCFFA